MTAKRPSLMALLLGGATVTTALAQSPASVLSGDTRLSCEAILCLTVAAAPAACRPALSRYFGIRPAHWSDLVRQRLRFLQLCPVSAQTPAMQSLVLAMSKGAGHCDAQSLNATLITEGPDGRRSIGNQWPDYCLAYFARPEISINQAPPVYIGSPEQGGFWAEAANRVEAQEQYLQQRAARDDRPLEPLPLNGRQ